VLLSVVSFSGLASLAVLLVEVVVKVSTRSGHIGHTYTMLYMAARLEDLPEHDAPWFLIAALCSILIYALALLVYGVLKTRWAAGRF
jgi:hypothetical protein